MDPSARAFSILAFLLGAGVALLFWITPIWVVWYYLLLAGFGLGGMILGGAAAVALPLGIAMVARRAWPRSVAFGACTVTALFMLAVLGLAVAG